MKTRNLLLLLILWSIGTYSLGQLPSVHLKQIDGKNINTAQLSKQQKPLIISFFATWCKPCLRELKAIHEVYDEWVEDTGVELIAVSIDDAQNSDKVKSLVNGLGWEYTVLLDPNSDFKRAMGVSLVPTVFIIGLDGNIIYTKSGYTDGSEIELIEKVKAHLQKKHEKTT